MLFLILVGLTAGCAAEATPAPGSPTATLPQMTPYIAHTPSPTPSLTPIITSTQEPLLPTPTPFTYTIQEGDTLFGLAIRFDTTVDEIVTANPDVNTNILSVGTELVIPKGEEDTASNIPTPTPLPVTLSTPACYKAMDGGLWCYVSARNDREIPLENISALVNLHQPNGNIAASEVAFPPLNVFNPEEDIPLAAYFPGPIPEQFQVFASQLTALPAESTRSAVEIAGHSISPGAGREFVTISGQLSLEGVDRNDLREIWIIAVAYDPNHQIVGLRKGVISQQELESGNEQEIPFNLRLYSLGPEIAEVELFTEHH